MSRRRAPGEPPDEWVVLTHAPHQPIAELICNILSEEGIENYARRAMAFDVPDFLAAGPRVVMVRRSQHERARTLLDQLERDGSDESSSGPNAR